MQQEPSNELETVEGSYNSAGALRSDSSRATYLANVAHNNA